MLKKIKPARWSGSVTPSLPMVSEKPLATHVSLEAFMLTLLFGLFPSPAAFLINNTCKQELNCT